MFKYNKSGRLKKITLRALALVFILVSLNYYSGSQNHTSKTFIAIKSNEEMSQYQDYELVMSPSGQDENSECIVTRLNEENNDVTHLLKCNSENELLIIEAIL